MQNIDTREFKDKLAENGYVPVRSNGSHTVYMASRTITDTMSVPTTGKTVNGCLAKRLTRQMENFIRR